MRKVGILLIVALLAVSGIMAAMAYSSASVTNAASMKVINTNDALVALAPNTGVGYNDATAWIEDNVLQFDFARGRGRHPLNLPFGERYGFQPGSTYTWERLFKISNNSKDAVVFHITQTNLKYITVELVDVAGGSVSGVVFIEDGVNKDPIVAGGLAAGDSGWIKVSFNIPADGDVEDITNGSLTIHTKAAATIGRHGPNAW